MGGYAGVYDATPDKQPVLGAIPEYSGLYADFGWSGHGFKHAPVIGDILVKRRTRPPVRPRPDPVPVVPLPGGRSVAAGLLDRADASQAPVGRSPMTSLRLTLATHEGACGRVDCRSLYCALLSYNVRSRGIWE
jgi:hypothetical protein